jgi:hypothetical protein
MSEKLQGAMNVIARHLDAIRLEVFAADARERMKLTFIARDPSSPEADIFVSEDAVDQVAELLIRTGARDDTK